MKSVRDQAVPLILPIPATWVVGMYDDIIARVTPCVVAMCIPTKSAPTNMPAFSY